MKIVLERHKNRVEERKKSEKNNGRMTEKYRKTFFNRFVSSENSSSFNSIFFSILV